MKSPCPECAASSVWVGFAKITLDRGEIVIRYRCGLCQHEWPVYKAPRQHAQGLVAPEAPPSRVMSVSSDAH